MGTISTAPVVNENEVLARRLRESEERFLAAASVSEDRAVIRPAEDSWSILEVVEHVTLSDREMLRCYLDAGGNQERLKPQAEAAIAKFGSDTAAKFAAPARVLPAGRHGSLADGLKAYREMRNELVDFVKAGGEELRDRILQHPMTDMDGHQVFLFIAAHSDRHVKQIEEIKKSAAYKDPL